MVVGLGQLVSLQLSTHLDKRGTVGRQVLLLTGLSKRLDETACAFASDAIVDGLKSNYVGWCY